ncbi:sulfate permease, SulP family [Desulfacinum infernum DSM 9756]|uniref:Sulfate permease, SulP family n=1 Tax=Desulfacinum infernum DSM 9756 TaxID=1121391 RepID=A0A1M5B8A2_9BACT|nr:putative sulfate/molybdate transporter [Desulfacinum infernum]SHF38665.1 sulfate permease, SulP family [Desulfacinum infernum DSM 9756]
MPKRYRFDRMEWAGSLGDLGTLLPLALGMIVVNGLDPAGLFFSVGIFYILSGLYFNLTVPIQPMKVIGAYAIVSALPATQILASGLLIGVFLLVIGVTGAMDVIGRWVPKPVVRGVQMSTGTLLMAQGVRFMLGTSTYQALRNAAEPYLSIQSLGPLPIGIALGVLGTFLTLLLLDNRKLPAGLVVVGGGLLLGVLFGTGDGFRDLSVGFYLPSWMPLGMPSRVDFSLALVMLVLPQIPMTLGNAVIAYVDLSREYFGERSRRVTYRAACVSMGLANLASFFLGGMPICHGAGGLAAHYRFGARTAGSNLIIGSLFVVLALVLGKHVYTASTLIPLAVLGVLLLFAGTQLALTILDMRERKDLFVVLVMLGITLASNLAAGFIVGILVAYLLRWKHLNV